MRNAAWSANLLVPNLVEHVEVTVDIVDIA